MQIVGGAEESSLIRRGDLGEGSRVKSKCMGKRMGKGKRKGKSQGKGEGSSERVTRDR
jgi:hypothetical protein